MEIVELLRSIYKLRGDTFSSAELFGAINRAADEIERLDGLRLQYGNKIVQLQNEIEYRNGNARRELEAEIERLHRAIVTQKEGKLLAEIERLQDHHARNLGWEKRARAAEAEIERLLEHVRRSERLGAEVEAEIERLRGILQFSENASRQESEGLRAEIERLQVALGCALADKLEQ